VSSSYSVAKRGNVYYLRHRITPDGRQVQVSLGVREQREAYRKAKQLVREAELKVALAKTSAQRDAENEAWSKEFLEAAEDKRLEMTKAFVDELQQGLDGASERRRQERAKEKAAEEAARARLEKEALARHLDMTNPRLDAFWCLGLKKEDDSGILIDWCKEGNRSPNTLIAYRTAWSRFRDYFPELQRMGDITPQVVKDFAKRCKRDTRRGERSLSASAVQQYLICIQGMFSAAIKEGWFEGSNPVKVDWKHNRDRVVKYLTRKEVGRLLKEAKKLDTATYLFIAVAVHTGMRKDEVANLRWEDIDFDRKVITLQAKSADPAEGIQEFQLKSKKARTVPLKQELAEMLQPYRKEKGYIIESRSGKEIKRTRYNLSAYFTVTHKNAKAKCTPHLLRHTFASWAAIEGVSIYKICEWLGHSTVQLTQDTYAHLQAHDDDIDRF